MESSDYIKPVVPSTESIDLGKLLMILRTSWIWIVLIFIVVNSVAYLFIRYTKNVYRSDSEIKLDVKKDATDFGIRQMVDNADVDIISGEIELIQSKLFLNHVLDRSAFEISFVSVGRVLNDELYRNLPVDITVHTNIHSFYDTRIEYAELDDNMYRLRVPDRGIEVNGSFGRRVLVGDLEMTLRKNHEFIKGDEVGYYFTINSRDVLLDYLRTNLIAEPLNYNANTIRVAFKDHNPFKAQAVLNKIDTIYLQYSYEQKNLANKQKIDWLSNELRQIESRMEAYEDYFENFTIKNKTNDLDLELTRTITSLNRIDSQRYEYTRRVREIDRLLVSMEEGNYTPPVWLRNALPVEVGENIEKLSELKLELDRLKLSYNEITFTFRQKQQAFESLKQRANAQLTDVRTRWTKQLEELVARKVELEKQFAAFPDKNTEFTKNQRFYKLYEEFYLTLMQSKSEFEIAQAGTTPDFKILSPASFSSRPISPNRIMIAGIGITLSLVFNFLFIAILYLLNNKITNLSELEKIKSAPVLGAIPVSRYSQDNGLHVLNYPRSMVSEAIRSLRTNLDFFQIRSKEKVIAVSSTVSGEGKSFVAMNLGAALALSRKRVVLIDLDMRKSKMEAIAPNYDRSKGMSTVLIRKHAWEDCVITTSLEHFDFIPAGPHPPNPSELLLNGEFEQLINTLRGAYDYVILDTPPVGLVTDGIMAMRHADISIYVFRANYSKKEFLSNLRRIISLNKFSNITTVLNAVPASTKTYGYGYYDDTETPKDKVTTVLEV